MRGKIETSNSPVGQKIYCPRKYLLCSKCKDIHFEINLSINYFNYAENFDFRSLVIFYIHFYGELNRQLIEQ